MENILKAIIEKVALGHTYNKLEVNFGIPNEESETEGYYLSKLNGWGSTPITEVLATDETVDVGELILQLDVLGIAHCI